MNFILYKESWLCWDIQAVAVVLLGTWSHERENMMKCDGQMPEGRSMDAGRTPEVR